MISLNVFRSYVRRFSILLFCVVTVNICSAQVTTYISGYIGNYLTDSLRFYIDTNPEIAHHSERMIKIPLVNGSFSSTIILQQPVLVTLYLKDGMVNFLLEPGDSLDLNVVRKDSVIFRGNGASKQNIMLAARQASAGVKKPQNNNYSNCLSVDDYLDMSKYVTEIQERRWAYLLKFKDSLSVSAFQLIQSELFNKAESYRAKKMRMLLLHKNKFGLSKNDLESIYDSTIGRSIILKVPLTDNTARLPSTISYLRAYNSVLYYRLMDFSEEEFNLKNVYSMLNERYSGLIRERLLVDFFRTYIKRTRAGDKDMEFCIRHYLSQAGYPHYKTFVLQEWEAVSSLARGKSAPDFRLPDSSGNLVSLKDFRGKVVLVDFWFTGCHPCARLVPTLAKIEERFRNNSDVVMVNISIDEKTSWLKSLKTQKYTTGRGISLYTNGERNQHAVIKNYNVDSYPRLVVIDRSGKIVYASPPDPRPEGNGDEFVRLIDQTLRNDLTVR